MRWPIEKRDAAIAVCKAFLQQYGNAYQAHPDDPYDQNFGAPDSATAQFSLPRLDHPATPDDVKAGRAIFSLEGTTRVYKFPDVPHGTVFQAEEVLVSGNWDRYYGVVREGGVARVPAAEMEFPEYSRWQANVTKAISGIIEAPDEMSGQIFNLSFATHHHLQLGTAVPVTITLYNHNGLDQMVPDSMLLPPGATGTLPAGIGLSLSYSGKVAPEAQRFTDPPFDYGPFRIFRCSRMGL
jgi:hypothetical protein